MRNFLQTLTIFILSTTTFFTLKAQENTLYGTGAGGNAPADIELTAMGMNAGINTTGSRNVFVGQAAAWRNTTGAYNTALGAFALGANEAGIENITLGYHAGTQIRGNNNIAIGSLSLSNFVGVQHFNSSSDVVAIGRQVGTYASGGGNALVIIGNEAGVHYAGGDRSTVIGHSAGRAIGGNDVVAIGYWAGSTNVGDGCIYIGSGMSTGVWGNPSNYTNHLFIGNSTNTEFLVGDILNGKLGINTNSPQNALDVCGKVRSDEVIIENNWCDYVFYKNYQLPSLIEEAKHIEEKGHLIGFKRLKTLEAENTQLKKEVKRLRSK